MNEPPDFERLHRTQIYRPGSSAIEAPLGERWAAPIRRLLEARYSFLPYRYADAGHLFRGMQSGAGRALSSASFAHFDGDHDMSRVEQDMGVLFVTHEVSDAVTVSKLWEGWPDAAILVLRAATFNRELDARRAAMLAIGDSGMVFRYPLLSAPLTGPDIEYLFVTRRFGETPPTGLRSKTVAIEGRSRAELEDNLTAAMDRLGLAPATPVASNEYPRAR